MALNVGKLFAELEIRDSQFKSGIASAKSSIQSLDQAAKTAGAKASTSMGQAGASAGQAFGSKLKPAVTAAGSQAGESAGKSFGSSLTNSLGVAAASASSAVKSKLGVGMSAGMAGAGLAAGTAFGAALAKGWGRLTAIDDAKAKLSGLGNDAASVTAIMTNALASVKGTSFGLEEAATTAAGVVAAGIKPGKELQGVLTTVADTATIAGMSMADMGTIFGSVAARGKLQGDDMLQLMSRGVPVLQLLAQSLGKTSAEVSDMVTKGQIDFKTFSTAMQEGMGGAAQKAGETVSGSLKNMGAALGRFGAMLAEPAFKLAPTVFGGITDGLDGAQGAIKGATSVFQGLPGPVRAAIEVFAGLKGAALLLNTALGARLLGGLKGAAAAVADMASSSLSSLGGLRGAWGRATAGAEGFAAKTGAVVRSAAGGIKGALSGVVSFLGGPWMIGLAAAGTAIALFMQRQQAVKQHSENIKTAAQGVAQALEDTAGRTDMAAGEISAYTQKAAAAALEQSKMAVSGESLASALEKIGVNGQLAAQGLAGNKAAQAATLAKLQEEADKSAKDNETQIGGGQSAISAAWNWLTKGDSGTNKASSMLKDYKKLVNEVEEQQAAIKREAANGGYKLEVAVDGTVELNSMAQAMKDFEANTKGAAAGVDILTKALTGLTDDSLTLHDAQAMVNSSIRDMQGLAGTLGEVGLDASGMIDTTTEAGAKADKAVRSLSEGFKQYAGALYESGIKGQTLVDQLQPMYQQFLDTAVGMGLTREQAESVANALGIIPKDVAINLGVKDEANTRALIDEIGGKVISMPDSKTIRVSALTEEAQAALQAAGFEVTAIPGTKDFTLVANTAAANAALDGARGRIDGIPPVKPVTITTPGYENVMAGLNELGIKVHSDNEKHIVITDTSPENIARLEKLGVKTTTLPDGTVVISDNSADVARNIDNNLAGKTTQGKHVITIEQRLMAPLVAGVWDAPMARGGIRQRAQGALDTAQIRNGSGNGIVQHTGFGPVRWAEGETGWEAFIPGAPSKRARATNILVETAKRMGYALIPRTNIRAMADGGLSESQAANARAIIAQGRAMGMSDNAIKAALATALVESNLRVLSNPAVPASGGFPNEGQGFDHDSVGIFQQRDFPEWGTVAQRMDPAESARMFYEHYQAAGGDSMDPAAASQAVQRSAIPGAYAGRMAEADRILADLGDTAAATKTAAQSGDGQRVFVTNWPGSSSYSSSSYTSAGPSLTDAATEAEAAAPEDPDRPEYHAAVINGQTMPFPALDMDNMPEQPDVAKTIGDAVVNSLMGDLGMGNGFLPTLIKSIPEVQRKFADEQQKRGPVVANNWNVTVANVEELIRKVQQREQISLIQYGGAL